MCNDLEKKEKIKTYGEVFTPDDIVCDMLDLIEDKVPQDKNYITATFLEPACGDGQILIRILYRKLEQVKLLPIEERPLGVLKALASTYGVDIQADNIETSRQRLKTLLYGNPVETFCTGNRVEVLQISDLGVNFTSIDSIIDFILLNNIIVGNTLECDDFKDNFVWLTSYNWLDADSVEIAKCPITNLDLEQDKKILQFSDIKVKDKITVLDYSKTRDTILTKSNQKKDKSFKRFTEILNSTNVPF